MGGFLDDVDDFLYYHCVIKMFFSFLTHLYFSRLESVECMVFPHADVFTWKDVSSSLSDNNSAFTSKITCSYFNSEVFWIGISPVLC